MSVLILLVASTVHPYTAHDERYLRAYDPDAFDGRGLISTTHDPAKAMRFSDLEHAVACWKLQSTVHPRRTDGQPNRPLSAYTVELVTV
jgi:hypothetical protein